MNRIGVLKKSDRGLTYSGSDFQIQLLTENFIAMKKPPRGTAEKIAKMTVASVYPLYVSKIERKGRTKKELNEVIKWLTGYDEKKLKSLIKDEVNFENFFKKCKLNPNAHLIKGVICGYKIEEIEDPLIRKARYLDKLVDELAKGKKMEKILRAE